MGSPVLTWIWGTGKITPRSLSRRLASVTILAHERAAVVQMVRDGNDNDDETRGVGMKGL